ncbi:hypothetical protein SHIRM173S_02266 [Streptomyces hirsutus]
MYGTGSPGASSAAWPHAAFASSMMIRNSSVPGVAVRHACCTRNSACTAAPPASLGTSARHTRSHCPPGASPARPGRAASSSEAAPTKACTRCQRSSLVASVPASSCCAPR